VCLRKIEREREREKRGRDKLGGEIQKVELKEPLRF
jgi:hypothetical protein